MVNVLFEAGADVNYQDSRGWTPLMIASSQGYESLAEFLLHKGANVDIKDKYGKKACDKAKTQSIFFMLSSAGIDTRMKQSKDQMLKFSDEKPLKSNDLHLDYDEDFKTTPSGSNKKTKKVHFL